MKQQHSFINIFCGGWLVVSLLGGVGKRCLKRFISGRVVCQKRLGFPSTHSQCGWKSQCRNAFWSCLKRQRHKGKLHVNTGTEQETETSLFQPNKVSMSEIGFRTGVSHLGQLKNLTDLSQMEPQCQLHHTMSFVCQLGIIPHTQRKMARENDRREIQETMVHIGNE